MYISHRSGQIFKYDSGLVGHEMIVTGTGRHNHIAICGAWPKQCQRFPAGLVGHNLPCLKPRCWLSTSSASSSMGASMSFNQIEPAGRPVGPWGERLVQQRVKQGCSNGFTALPDRTVANACAGHLPEVSGQPACREEDMENHSHDQRACRHSSRNAGRGNDGSQYGTPQKRYSGVIDCVRQLPKGITF